MLSSDLNDSKKRLRTKRSSLDELWIASCDDITYEEEDLITAELCWKSNVIAARENLDRTGESQLGKYWQARLADAKDRLRETQDRIFQVL